MSVGSRRDSPVAGRKGRRARNDRRYSDVRHTHETYDLARGGPARNAVAVAFAIGTGATMFAQHVGPGRSGSAEWSATAHRVHRRNRAFAGPGFPRSLARNGNGAESYGNPITPEITLENGHIVQYFQYARFEYWPEGDANGGSYTFVANIGEELRPISVTALGRDLELHRRKARRAREARKSLRISQAWLPLAADAVNPPTRMLATSRRHSTRLAEVPLPSGKPPARPGISAIR